MPGSRRSTRPNRQTQQSGRTQNWIKPGGNVTADDRPWGGSDPPGVAYVYAPDRKAERPIAHLEGFKGILQVDGYAGYRKLADRGDVRLAFCWSHVRRGFYELATPGPSPIASEANTLPRSMPSRKTFAVVTLTSVEQPGNREAAR
jgi:hypothetical protein